MPFKVACVYATVQNQGYNNGNKNNVNNSQRQQITTTAVVITGTGSNVTTGQWNNVQQLSTTQSTKTNTEYWAGGEKQHPPTTPSGLHPPPTTPINTYLGSNFNPWVIVYTNQELLKLLTTQQWVTDNVRWESTACKLGWVTRVHRTNRNGHPVVWGRGTTASWVGSHKHNVQINK